MSVTSVRIDMSTANCHWPLVHFLSQMSSTASTFLLFFFFVLFAVWSVRVDCAYMDVLLWFKRCCCCCIGLIRLLLTAFVLLKLQFSRLMRLHRCEWNTFQLFIIFFSLRLLGRWLAERSTHFLDFRLQSLCWSDLFAFWCVRNDLLFAWNSLTNFWSWSESTFLCLFTACFCLLQWNSTD